jgi:altronate hydrolase
MKQVMKVHPEDDLLIALVDLPSGAEVTYDGITYQVIEDIPAKHKIYTKDFNAKAPIRMYGVHIGNTTASVKTGSRVRTENLAHGADAYAYRGFRADWLPPNVESFRERHFQGYHRSDGRVGTANYWLFIPLVFCENRNLDVIRDAMLEELGYSVTSGFRKLTRILAEQYERGVQESIPEFIPIPEVKRRIFRNVDGIKFLNHQGGCGGIRQDAALLGRLLAAYANHPNVGGVTVLSLGCQNLQAADFRTYLKELNPQFDKPLYFFEQQESVSEPSFIAEAIRATFHGMQEINKLERKPASLDKLCVGVKCGGSDGFSGISANPAVGHCADLLSALGAKVILAEFPELCGVEQDLLDRTTDPAAAEKFIHLMSRFSDLVEKAGSGFSMNPSPGNIRDGLITDAMKSAGAARKGGHSPIVDVLDYTEQATRPGLSLLCTPGNDVEATTGKAASGATLILFTTGLGTPTGNPVCPTIKISSNTALYNRMRDIIDIDSGPVIEGIVSIEEMGQDILEYCIRAASGEIIPKAVQLNQDDFIPWKRGVSL